ncbi:MAG: sugar phosphate isomerase/epimerase [Vicinamibacteria bacterium]|nr:sugar phosphate isomerase/epimerase [Vicinamibacteria bacterium]
MSLITRREWNRMALLGCVSTLVAPRRGRADTPASAPSPAPRPRAAVAGVPLGIHTMSFSDRSLDQTTPIILAIGAGLCELWHGHIEPKELVTEGGDREQLRRWRMNVPLDDLARTRADLAGKSLRVIGIEMPFASDFTDAEIERGLKIAQALGVDLVAGSTDQAMLDRVLPFAREYKIRIGFINGAKGPIRSPEDIDRLLASNAGETAFVLDVAELTAAGHDPLAVLSKHVSRIAAVHLRDRKRDGGPSVVWGQGDTPLGEILGLLRKTKRCPPVLIRYDYSGADRVDEVRRCYEFCVKALEA